MTDFDKVEYSDPEGSPRRPAQRRVERSGRRGMASDLRFG